MNRLLFFIRAYQARFRFQILPLLILEKLVPNAHFIFKIFNHSFVESRRILGYAYDKGGNVKSFETGMELSITLTNRPVFFFMRWDSSDFLVFEQVIVKNEYQPIIDLVNKYKLNVESIIDAGGNIGCTTIFLKSYFPQAQIAIVEPDLQNFEILKKNIDRNKLNSICIPLALWHTSTQVSLTSEHLDKRNWSIKVAEQGDTKVDTITLSDLFKKMNLNKLDILKMDIEGAEGSIFKYDSELTNLLKKTLIVAIEIHSESDKEFILKFLRGLHFETFHESETIFGINIKYVVR